MKNLVVILVLILLILAGFWVFNSSDDQEGPIKIGFTGPLTGALASIGESSLGGALLAVKEINENGGLLGRSVELIAEDDMCSPEEGVVAMNKLVNLDNVVAISGPDCSSVGSAVLPIAESKNIPVVIRWASNPKLTSIGDNVFRVYPSDGAQGKFIADYIYNKLGKKKVAILHVKDDWGQGLSDVFRETYLNLGGEIVYDEGVLVDSRDLRKQMTDIANSAAEALFSPLHEANSVAGLRQAKELGLNIPIIGGDVFGSAAVIESGHSDGAMFSIGKINKPESFQERIKSEVGKKEN